MRILSNIVGKRFVPRHPVNALSMLDSRLRSDIGIERALAPAAVPSAFCPAVVFDASAR